MPYHVSSGPKIPIVGLIKELGEMPPERKNLLTGQLTQFSSQPPALFVHVIRCSDVYPLHERPELVDVHNLQAASKSERSTLVSGCSNRQCTLGPNFTFYWH